MKILVLEAGKDSAEMDNMHMAGACVFSTLLGFQGPIDGSISNEVQLDYES